jgi:DHA1 family inner membrane transport protein
VALATGVPLGIFIGQQFGWRETFLAVSLLGAIAFIDSLLFVPHSVQHSKPASIAFDQRQMQQIATLDRNERLANPGFAPEWD